MKKAIDIFRDLDDVVALFNQVQNPKPSAASLVTADQATRSSEASLAAPPNTPASGARSKTDDFGAVQRLACSSRHVAAVAPQKASQQGTVPTRTAGNMHPLDGPRR